MPYQGLFGTFPEDRVSGILPNGSPWNESVQKHYGHAQSAIIKSHFQTCRFSFSLTLFSDTTYHHCRYHKTIAINRISFRFYSYTPRYHVHVTSPPNKQKCFAGFGICSKNEVVMTVFKNLTTHSPFLVLLKNRGRRVSVPRLIRITFNKGCSCQMHANLIAIGDGN